MKKISHENKNDFNKVGLKMCKNTEKSIDEENCPYHTLEYKHLHQMKSSLYTSDTAQEWVECTMCRTRLSNYIFKKVTQHKPREVE